VTHLQTILLSAEIVGLRDTGVQNIVLKVPIVVDGAVSPLELVGIADSVFSGDAVTTNPTNNTNVRYKIEDNVVLGSVVDAGEVVALANRPAVLLSLLPSDWSGEKFVLEVTGLDKVRALEASRRPCAISLAGVLGDTIGEKAAVAASLHVDSVGGN
jgi:hypothetical protein